MTWWQWAILGADITIILLLVAIVLLLFALVYGDPK